MRTRIDAPSVPSSNRFLRTRSDQFNRRCRGVCLSILNLCLLFAGAAQAGLAEGHGTEAVAAAGSAAILNIIRWNGSLPEAAGRTVEVRFALYQDQEGGVALWNETQTVKVGADGKYSVLLGVASAEGLPSMLFQAAQARWIEAKPTGTVNEEASAGTSRALLAAVPYAFKAADAETLAGRAAWDYVTREDLQAAVANGASAPALVHPDTSPSGSGTAGYVPLWTGTTTLGNSVMSESGTKIGIDTATPATTLDVNGTSALRGNVTIPPLGTATASGGFSSPVFAMSASSFMSGGPAMNQEFAWEVQPQGNNTANPSSVLSLLYASGTNGVNNTGLSILPTGSIYSKANMTVLANAATPTTAGSSPKMVFEASAYNSATAQSVPQNFALSAFPSSNNTPNPSANLALEYSSGSAGPVPTGLSFSPTGVITFVPSQTFPGQGVLTGVTAGTDLTGGGTTGTVTLNVDTSKVVTGVTAGTGLTGGGTGGTPTVAVDTSMVPLLSANNTFTGGDSFENGMDANGVDGPAATFAGGAVGALGQPGLTAAGGSTAITGVAYGGPGMSANGGSGLGGFGVQGGGDGVDGSGGSSSQSASVGGNGGTFWGGTVGPEVYGGNGVYSFGGIGEQGGYGVSAFGGDTVFGCSNLCTAGAGGVFNGGAGPATNGGDGVLGYAGDQGGTGVVGVSCAGYSDSPNCQYAALFLGDVDVVGNVSKSGGSFKIDHPLDPENKYLYHSFVESPDMKNIYDGTVTTDGDGRATVAMPEWFEALNSDFRYQLTVIGQFAQAIVDTEISNNAFTIRTDKPNVKVSWQVTGIRQDAWAKAHRIPVEAEKTVADKGHYLHPELFGHKGEPSIGELHHPRPKIHRRR